MNVNVEPIKLSELGGAFVVADPQWREKIFFGGLLVLFVHPFGWPVALGYRKELIARLRSGVDPLLPEWNGNLLKYYLEGIKAMGVIFGYLAPLYLTLIILLIANGIYPSLTWLYVSLFFLICTIFSTLSFPSLLTYWTFFSEGYRVPPIVAASLYLLFIVVIFFIPAGFLQVSRTGNYHSAFNLRAAWGTLTKHLSSYVAAWYRSILLSLTGHFALPFAPWGVVWCYLGIIFEFNAILSESPAVDHDPSWFRRLGSVNQLLVKHTGSKHIVACVNAADSAAQDCYLLRLAGIIIPLPKMLARVLV